MKNSSFNEPVGRREFLRGGVRYGLLVGLAALGARAISNGGRLGNQNCSNKGICRGCPDYSACELPQALSAKESGPGVDTGGAYVEIRRIPGVGMTSRHLEIGPDDRLYVSTGNSVLVLTQDGERVREIALGSPVRCVAVAGDGTIFAGLRDRIEIFDTNGNRKSAWDIPNKRAWLTGLAVGTNDLFAADAGNRVILRYDLAGKLVGRIGEKNADRDIPGFVIPCTLR